LPIVLFTASCEPPDYLRERIEQESNESWDALQLSKVVVRNMKGDVSVSAGNDSLVSARVTRYCTGNDSTDALANIGRIEVSTEVEDRTLTIEVEIPEADPRVFGADVEVTVPALTAVDLQTTDGNIELDRINARMIANTTRGDVTTHGVRGHLSAFSSGGNLDIDVADLTTYFELSLASANGTVMVYLPDNSSTTFTAHATGGRATVTGFSDIHFSVDEENEKVGIIGSGAALLNATATGGNVAIRAK